MRRAKPEWPMLAERRLHNRLVSGHWRLIPGLEDTAGFGIDPSSN